MNLLRVIFESIGIVEIVGTGCDGEGVLGGRNAAFFGSTRERLVGFLSGRILWH